MFSKMPISCAAIALVVSMHSLPAYSVINQEVVPTPSVEASENLLLMTSADKTAETQKYFTVTKETSTSATVVAGHGGPGGG